MPTTEHTINDTLAAVLRKTRHSWRDSDVVKSEQSGMLKGNSAQPDILVIEPNVSPVVIEVEVLPAVSVETEAIERLGEQLRITGRTILSSIAVRLPERIRSKQAVSLSSELEIAADIEMALYSGSNPSTFTRWPCSGWIIGSVADLSVLVQSASVPPEIIEGAVNILVGGVSEAAGLLNEMVKDHEGAIHKISQALCQEDGDQTRRMAMTILANAFMFHEILAGGQDELADVNSLEQLRGSSNGLSKSSILTEWRKILKVNYWPIFDIARRIFEDIPTSESQSLIDCLAKTAEKLLQNRLMRSHDLTGAVFQRLISDRKFLAAYYTTPASAALLVGLAITPNMLPAGKSWSRPDDIKSLRIADFACGTGTLLSTAYQRISQLHEIAGGDSEKLHPEMMASVLVGCDVLPAAAHLTASMLAGAHPSVKYTRSSIMTVPYGKQLDGSIALGSLDLLEAQGQLDLLFTAARFAEGTGEGERKARQEIPHASFDVVLMNPPFTRATGQEGKKIGVPNPMFAAFSSSAEEQGLMAKATEKLTKGTSAHGNAGEASFFLVLGDRKLKPEGILALVMPLSLLAGESWEDTRTYLSKNYIDLILVSIAGVDDADLSFSSDTGMGECLAVGCKSKVGSKRANFVILKERPSYPLIGSSIAEQIHRLITSGNVRCLEDGPVGGTLIHFGLDEVGEILNAPLPLSGGWNLSRISDLSLAQTAFQLSNNNSVWLPTMNKSEIVNIPITTVADIGQIGPYHADINGTTQTGGFRGPFDLFPIKPHSTPTYPVLWAHNADLERSMLFDADNEGAPRRGTNPKDQMAIDQKVKDIWNTASHCHFNRDFRFNSQSTGMQFTNRRTIGGRAWLSIRLSSVDQEKALVLWANTSLGMLLHWWHSNKQQSGRGSIGKLPLQTLPILNVSALSPKQIDAAVQIFADMSSQHLLTFNEIDKDIVRRELDERFSREVLELPESILSQGGPLEILRMKLSKEPSIRGSK